MLYYVWRSRWCVCVCLHQTLRMTKVWCQKTKWECKHSAIPGKITICLALSTVLRLLCSKRRVGCHKIRKKTYDCLWVCVWKWWWQDEGRGSGPIIFVYYPNLGEKKRRFFWDNCPLKHTQNYITPSLWKIYIFKKYLGSSTFFYVHGSQGLFGTPGNSQDPFRVPVRSKLFS